MCSEVTIKSPTWRDVPGYGWQLVRGADLVATITGTTYVVLAVTADEEPAHTVTVQADDLRRIVQVLDALGVG